MRRGVLCLTLLICGGVGVLVMNYLAVVESEHKKSSEAFARGGQLLDATLPDVLGSVPSVRSIGRWR
jgi:hypothetical protein